MRMGKPLEALLVCVRRSKASALVVMSSVAEAHKAAGSVCGDLDNPLLVVPLLKVGVW